MIKQVIIIRTDLNMRKGKMCAQAAHAAMGAYAQCNNANVQDQWFETGATKVCVGVSSFKELNTINRAALDSGLSCYMVRDEGRTEFNNVPTYTALAIGPGDSDEIDKITGKLKLL